MVDITIFEVHLDGSEFTANAPLSGADESAESVDADTESDGSGGAPLGLFAVAAVLGLVALVVAAKKVSGGDADLDEITDEIA